MDTTMLFKKSGESESDIAPTLWGSVGKGAIGFASASLSVFATVAFAERWMYTNLGFGGAYFVWTVLFILLGGWVLHPLVIGKERGWKFYVLFGCAFLA